MPRDETGSNQGQDAPDVAGLNRGLSLADERCQKIRERQKPVQGTC